MGVLFFGRKLGCCNGTDIAKMSYVSVLCPRERRRPDGTERNVGRAVEGRGERERGRGGGEGRK